MGGALPPLRDRLRVDAIAPGERSQALLTMLYRSTDRRRRCGAPVVNLAHSASFHSRGKGAPANHRIKHLALGHVLRIGLPFEGGPARFLVSAGRGSRAVQKRPTPCAWA